MIAMNDKYRVLSITDTDQWFALLKKIPEPDLHFEPGYMRIFEQEGEAKLFIYEKGNQFIAYPFILRKLDGGLYDISSPYGYGGPLYEPGIEQQMVEEFYDCFKHYCRDNQIITEFIRFHPLLQNHRLITGLVEVHRNSTVVFIDLSKTLEQIRSDYRYSNRKNINKAVREEVVVTIDNSPRYYTDFINIYRETMDRNNAQQFYYFGPDFFDRLHNYLHNNYIYAHAWKNGRIVASELLIYNRFYMHSFLGGTLADFFVYRPNNLLKHETIKWAKEQGIKYFILGGGRSDDDGIYRYKSTFSRDFTGYYTGKKIHNHETVAKLVSAMAPQKQKEGFFPPYRR